MGWMLIVDCLLIVVCVVINRLGYWGSSLFLGGYWVFG